MTDAETRVPASRCLPDTVRAGAAHADAGGVIDLDGELTPWPVIDAAIEAFARGLCGLGIGLGDRVVVAHQKSQHSFVAAHAVMRSGAVFVPVDPLSSQVLFQEIVTATDAAIVVGDATTLGRLCDGDHPGAVATLVMTDGHPDTQITSPAGCRVIHYDECVAHGSPSGDLPHLDPDADAYILFTSGSTGTPKGIVHTHRSGLAYARQAALAHRLTPTSRLAGTAPLHFDMSMLELYSIPLVGATAVMVSEAEKTVSRNAEPTSCRAAGNSPLCRALRLTTAARSWGTR